MKKVRAFLFLATALVSTSVLAREAVPIGNHINVAIITSGKPASADKIKQAIMAAAAAQKWNISETQPGTLTATLQVRGKHTVVVDIPYTADHFSVKYKDSVNMKYEVKDNVPVIHPFYNKWVQQLVYAIHAETKKL